ncbi:MAG: hypothetical protein Q7S31_03980 [bacterium]|nr:hypothetical protein [bacterium]
MKKLALGIIVFLLGATVVAAQSAGDLFNSAVNYGTSYRTAYLAYVQAKNQYQQYHTGVTRVEAISKTNDVLVKRNQWVIAYLKFLRQTLAEVTNIATYPQTVTYLDLEKNIAALEGLTSLGGGDNFAAINTASQDWEKQMTQMDRMVLAARMQVSSTRLANFQDQLAGYLDAYRQEHATPSASQKTTLDLIGEKLNSSVQLRQQTDALLAKYRTGFVSNANYAQGLNDSHQALVESAKLLNELSRQP